jgi:Uncharacterized membrane protein, possible Na+ channel or pump
MIGLGTIVNAAAIIFGALIGLLLKNGISERYKIILMQAIGLSVVIIGISGTLQGMYKVLDTGKLDRSYIMTMIFSLVIGSITGEALGIEKRLENLGEKLQNRFSKSGGTFAEGFVTASLVYCIGAMAIMGALEDGLMNNYSTLFSKAILDGVSAVVFSATMGIGVLFSSVPVFVYQGSITLLAGALKPVLTPEVISQISVVGSVLILGIGINILEIKKIKVGNMLPAIFIPVIYYVITLMF